MLSYSSSWRTGAAILGLSLLVAACGYRPLYGQSGAATGPAVREQLAEVTILPVSNRIGQQLRNGLIDRMSPSGHRESGIYRLAIILDESREELAVRRDETATRANLHLEARYRLQDTRNGVVLYTGRSRSTTSYNIVRSEFATQSAIRDAQQRATELLADDITTQIALYFNRRQQNPNE